MAITLQEAKEYLRVGYDDDNDYITELIDMHTVKKINTVVKKNIRKVADLQPSYRRK